MSYLRNHLRRDVPQSEPLDDNQIQNAAGGYVYKISPMDQVRRFLVMGTEGGTYYTKETELTKANCKNLSKAIQTNGVEVVNMALEVSDNGRAKKNDMAIFALALAMAEGDLETKRQVRKVYTKVARTGTHHLMFVDFLSSMRKGIGKLPKYTIGDWYAEKTDEQLAYQVVKYQSRSGYTHRDVLQKIHYGKNTPLYRWITRNGLDARTNFAGEHSAVGGELPEIIHGYELAKALGNDENATDAEVIKMIETYNLTHEMVPNRFKNSAKVWEALLPHMPITALIRNLGKMSSLNMFPNMSRENQNTDLVIDKINQESVRKGRLHPITVLAAMRTYEGGEGIRGDNTWSANKEIVDHLEDAFYWAFDTVEPTGKNMMLALDVSGSMTWSYPMASSPNLTCAEIAAVMAMVSLRTEPRSYICGFADTFRDLPITKRSTLREATSVTRDMSFGRTDCAQPMIEALQRGYDVDGFAVYTDNETWAGRIHPKKALETYRERKGIDARLVVLGMTATECSIADPTVPYMADFVGISNDTPRMVSEFLAGRF